MTTQPGPDARPSTLHRRLTVALAAAAKRSDIAAALHEALDRRSGSTAVLLGPADLSRAAEGFAEARAEDRAELRMRLDAAAGRAAEAADAARGALRALVDRRDVLLAGATWAREVDAELADRQAAVDEARRVVDARRSERRQAQVALDRVLEQRAAATAAVEEADRQLADLSGVGMDESGLRRELEAAGGAVGGARHAHEEAAEAVRRLEAEQAQAQAELARLCDLAPDTASSVDIVTIEAVLDAFEALRDAAVDAGTDPEAGELAAAWSDLMADLAEVEAGAPPRPGEAQVRAARERFEVAAAALQRVERTQVTPLSASERAAIDAAHAAVLAAEERSDRRVGGSAARRRIEHARSAERALLDAHGFAGYLDVVLSGGRAGADDPERSEAEREYLTAAAELDALTRALRGPSELAYLESERERLLGHSRELLGVEPGDAVIALLRSHPQVPRTTVTALRDALGRAGVRPSGISLLAAAEAWLADQRDLVGQHDEVEEERRRQEAHVAELQVRADALAPELAEARLALEAAGGELELAERSVGRFEAELSKRADEDAQRLQRLAAAEQLRAQVDAVQAALRSAEESSRATLAEAEASLGAAEVAHDRAVAAVAELSRRARQLCEELPVEARPEGDPLDARQDLAAALAECASDLHDDIDAADAAAFTAQADLDEAQRAASLVSLEAEGPLREDLVDGFEQLLAAEAPDTVLVLDAPFAELSSGLVHELLDLLRERSEQRQCVLLTDDPDVLGWAIELPADVGTAVPARAVLDRLLAVPATDPTPYASRRARQT